MSMIPTCTKPYPDELLYSVICRTADKCAVPIDYFFQKYLSNTTAVSAYIVPDVRREFPVFVRSLPYDVDMADYYLSTTTFCFEAMAMTRGQQTRHTNAVFRPIDPLNPVAGSLFDKVKICPECVKADIEKYGEPYLHCSHHLAGVCTCHIHKVPLLTYNGKPTHECEFNMDDYIEPEPVYEPDDALAYTAYAQKLHEAKIDTDVSALKDVILGRINDLGHGASDDYKSFIDVFSKWEHEDLWRPTDRSRFLKRSLTILANTTITNLVPLLMYLYPDVDELTGLLSGGSPLIENHTCPECGCEYCATPMATQTGWGCPYCDSHIPIESRFKSLVKTAGKGKYKTLSEFQSLQKRIPFHHKTCGKDTYLRPTDFLYAGVRCKCENMVTESEVRKVIERSGDYKLLKFIPVEKTVTIKSLACGHVFSCRYYPFIKSPHCRVCKEDRK